MSGCADVWVIGDVQGCAHSLEQLLAHPELNHPSTQFVFLGDLVNRGPDSLGVLRQIIALGDRAHSVLGNHDIHLLGVAAGLRQLHPSDTLMPILEASDSAELIDWLRQRPLALHKSGHLMVHAGIHPAWRLATVLELAAEVEASLHSPHWAQQLQPLFGNEPTQWSANLTAVDRQRYTINTLTRLRYFDAQGTIHYRFKGHPSANEVEQLQLTPWFAIANRQLELPVLFGHWSTLGLHLQADAMGLDTGCLWGGQLTALRLSDRKVVQVPNTDGALQPF